MGACMRESNQVMQQELQWGVEDLKGRIASAYITDLFMILKTLLDLLRKEIRAQWKLLS